LYIPLAASWPISSKGEPGSSSRFTRSRDVPLAMLVRPAQCGLGDASAKLVGERAIVSGEAAEGIRAFVDL
jgi:hypothetical protein